jgi:hypothetical protein
MYDDFEDLDILEDDDEELFEEKPRSRRFTVIAGILGVLIVFAIITVAAYLLFNKSDETNNTVDDTAAVLSANQTATAQAQQDFIADSLTQTAVALDSKAAATEAAPTEEPTNATQGGATPTVDANATVQAAYTQAVALQTETIVPTATSTDALPDTGLIDDLGIPGIVAFSTLLFIVIIVARRVRTNNT